MLLDNKNADINVSDEKAKNNEDYLAKLDRAFDQLESGRGQVHELIEDTDSE